MENVPWFANQFRIASLPDHATTAHPSWNGWWGAMSPPQPYLALWEPEGNPDDASRRDNVSGLSFCADGTLWVASANHGLARLARDGTTTFVDLPTGYGNAASAVGCDPADGSVWVGFSFGGYARWNGAWDSRYFVAPDAPQFTWNPVRNIQIDRFTTPRAVYFAHEQSTKYGPGGVTVYTGP